MTTEGGACNGLEAVVDTGMDLSIGGEAVLFVVEPPLTSDEVGAVSVCLAAGMAVEAVVMVGPGAGTAVVVIRSAAGGVGEGERAGGANTGNRGGPAAGPDEFVGLGLGFCSLGDGQMGDGWRTGAAGPAVVLISIFSTLEGSEA